MKNILIVSLNYAIDKTIMVPKLVKGKIYRISEVKTLPGGKGVNVARALEALGRKTTMIGFVGGHNGKWIMDSLACEGLAAICIPFPGESRVCYSIVDASDGLPTDFNEEGQKVPLKAQKIFLKEYVKALKHCDAVAFCGRIAGGLKKDFFAKLIRIAKQHGKRTAIDTSGIPLREAVSAGPALLKMNKAEFKEASGEELSSAAIIRFFKKASRKGTDYVVVTNGAKATYAVTPENLWKFYPAPIRVVTPIGAGDSFMAGLLYGFSLGLSRQECARIALGAASSDCLSLGAGIIDKEQSMYFAQRAKLQRLQSISSVKRKLAVPA